MDIKVPALRSDLEVIPMSYQGRQGVLIRDFLGVLKDPVFIQGEGLMVLSLIDGRRLLKDIQLELIRQKEGSFISLESVNKVVSEFDAAFLLDNAEYRKKRDQITAGYLAEETREAVLAGTAYPASPDELSAYVESILSGNGGERSQSSFSDVRALIAPHIDIKTGRDVYAAAYREVRGLTPKKILVLGVGHHLQNEFLSLSEKDYLTPLGRVKTDKIWVKRLKEIGKEVVVPHDITHKMEHSIEFQLLFLQRLYGPDFQLIPVLCGSFSDVLYSASRPSEILGMKSFLEGLREFLREDPETLVVAGVDFSHIGPKFGHREKALSMLLETRAFDQKLMAAVCEGEVEKFWGLYRESGGRFNVCGFSALSILLELIPDIKGRILGYDLWQEEGTESAVSFAAMALS